MFDPDVYPLNTAFLTGYSVKEDEQPGELVTASGGKAPAPPK
jgi:hypothetical protein